MGVGTPYALAATRSRARAVERLSAARCRVGLDGVLADLDRTAERCTVPGAASGNGFTWDARDRDDPSWWPQGIASIRTGDVLLVAWYSRRRGLAPTPGTRISVVDRSDPDRPRYRHVLLVVPRRLPGLRATGAVRVHAGGIAVCGDLLYVADTVLGLRLFRLRDVLRVGPTGPSRGSTYVLPQLTAFRVPVRSGRHRLRYSFLSTGELDRQPSLVVGEYRRAGASPRLAVYPIDPSTCLPAVDGRGRVAPSEVHEGQPDRMQGAAVHGSGWWVTASAGEGVAGDLYTGAPHGWVRHRGVLPTGPEDLAWSRPGEELWCASEWPGRRWVFPIDPGRWRPSPDPGGADGA
ncbi:hypothetical protein [Blastococcus haudaquaticus]|uniref:Secreted protein n=1 Tax=Blastococcus haudaquaticus TaxID=1938745 RepID=A0A286GGE1_9ACTN|nr:hypothetical protein [Blastococcus haudaquaticus]SOD94560.1 hypothetical protein SAMN06272739_0899 [Blastococcus haudaquaticus]